MTYVMHMITDDIRIACTIKTRDCTHRFSQKKK